MNQSAGSPMVERVLEVVTFLVRRIQDEGGRLESFDGAANDLRDLGFSAREISSAYGWLAGKQPTDVSSVSLSLAKPPTTLRVLSDRERGAFTPGGQGELLALSASGILDDTALEAVIEHAAWSDAPLDPAAVRRATVAFLLGDARLSPDEDLPVH